MSNGRLQPIPGPGQYDYTGSTNNGRAAVIRGTGGNRTMHVDSPGPGAYDVELSSRIPRGYSLGNGQRLRRHDDAIPGPGDYSITRDLIGGTGSFGKSKRPGLGNTRDSLPGPGSYDSPQRSGKT
jgi:hypothetical protein